MGEMIGDRFLRDPQLLRNLFVAFATGNQLEHGNLTLCQVGRKCRICSELPSSEAESQREKTVPSWENLVKWGNGRGAETTANRE
jgi:hypothetical protein